MDEKRGPGRPKMNEKDTRNKKLQIRLTSDEAEFLREMARMSGVSISDYVRINAIRKGSPIVAFNYDNESTKL